MAASHQDHSDHHHPGLDVELERTGPCRAKISFEVSAEEFAKGRAQALKALAGRTRFKGFRPGKAPMALLEREYGDAVNRDVAEHFLNDAFSRALKEHNLQPATRPRVDLDDVQPKTGEGFSLSFEVTLRPDFELGQVRGIEVDRQPTSVDDEEVAQALEDVRRQHARPEPAGDEGLAADGMTVVKLVLLAEGEEEPVVERDGVRLSPKSAPSGVDPKLYEKEMIGAKPGDTRSFTLEYPEDFPEEAARGKKGTCEITLNEVFAFQVPNDEELQRVFEVEDADGLNAAIRSRMETARAEQEEQRIETELLSKLIDAHPMELPEDLVEQQAEARLSELRENLEGQGLSEEERGTRMAQEEPGARDASRRALSAMYLIEEIAKAEELQISSEDVAQEFEAIAKRNGVSLDEVRKYYQEEGLLQQLGMELMERKVRSFLRSSADIRQGA